MPQGDFKIGAWAATELDAAKTAVVTVVEPAAAAVADAGDDAAEAVVDAGGAAADAIVDVAEPAVEAVEAWAARQPLSEQISARWRAFAEYVRLDKYAETISMLASIAIGWTAFIVVFYCCLTKMLFKERKAKGHGRQQADVEGGRASGRGARRTGWETFEDDLSGATYYHNTYTGQTTLEDPGFERMEDPGFERMSTLSEPFQLLEEVDEASGRGAPEAAASESTQLLSSSQERSDAVAASSSLLADTPSSQMRSAVEKVEVDTCSPVTPSPASSTCTSSAMAQTPLSALPLSQQPTPNSAMPPSPVEAEAATSPHIIADAPAPSSVFNFFGSIFQGLSLETSKLSGAGAGSSQRSHRNNSSRNSDRGSNRRPGSWRRGSNSSAAQAAEAYMAGAQEAAGSSSTAPSSSPPSRSRANKLKLPPVPLTRLPERFPADRNALNNGVAPADGEAGSDSWRSSIFGRSSGISSGITALTDRLVESTPAASRRSYRKLVAGDEDPSGGSSSYRSPGPDTFSTRRKMFELGQLELERQEREELDRIGWTPPPPKLLPRAGSPGEDGYEYAA